jgi:starvation-inducible DNA-binding protein
VAPDGRVGRIAGDSPADPAPGGWVEVGDVVRTMARRIEAVARRTRDALDGLGDHDLVSEGLVTEILEGLEMQLWMVSAQEA